VANCILARDRTTGKSKGFAFVEYEDPRSAVLAVDNFGGFKVRFQDFKSLIIQLISRIELSWSVAHCVSTTTARTVSHNPTKKSKMRDRMTGAMTVAEVVVAVVVAVDAVEVGVAQPRVVLSCQTTSGASLLSGVAPPRPGVVAARPPRAVGVEARTGVAAAGPRPAQTTAAAAPPGAAALSAARAAAAAAGRRAAAGRLVAAAGTHAAAAAAVTVTATATARHGAAVGHRGPARRYGTGRHAAAAAARLQRRLR
jgi:hypothetical protein